MSFSVSWCIQGPFFFPPFFFFFFTCRPPSLHSRPTLHLIWVFSASGPQPRALPSILLHLISLSHLILSQASSDICPPPVPLPPLSVFVSLWIRPSYRTFRWWHFLQDEAPVVWVHLDQDYSVVQVLSVRAEVTGVVTPVHLLHQDPHLVPLQRRIEFHPWEGEAKTSMI